MTEAVCTDCDSAGVLLIIFRNLPNASKREGKNQNFWGNEKKEDMLKEGHKKSPCLEMLGTDDKSDTSTFLDLQRLP